MDILYRIKITCKNCIPHYNFCVTTFSLSVGIRDREIMCDRVMKTRISSYFFRHLINRKPYYRELIEQKTKSRFPIVIRVCKSLHFLLSLYMKKRIFSVIVNLTKGCVAEVLLNE